MTTLHPDRKYAVMGCSGAKPWHFKTLATAVKKARSCARSGHVPVNVTKNAASASPWSRSGTSKIVFRCTNRGTKGKTVCGAPGHIGESYAGWERQAKVDGHLGRGKRKRKGRKANKACSTNIGAKKAPKALRSVRR